MSCLPFAKEQGKKRRLITVVWSRWIRPAVTEVTGKRGKKRITRENHIGGEGRRRKLWEGYP